MSYETFHCTVVPEDILKIEKEFQDHALGFEATTAKGVRVCVCLDVDQIKALIKQLQKAVKDTGQ